MSTDKPNRYAQLVSNLVATADHAVEQFITHIDRDDLGAELVSQEYRRSRNNRGLVLTNVQTRLEFTAVQLKTLADLDDTVIAAAELLTLAAELVYVTANASDVGDERDYHMHATADDLIAVADRVRKDERPLPTPDSA